MKPKQKIINQYLKGGYINLYDLEKELKKIGYDDSEIKEIIKNEVIGI